MPVIAALRDRLLRIVESQSTLVESERLMGHALESVAVHPSQPNRIFCGTFDCGLQRSVDGGDSWERIGQVAIDPEEKPATAERRGVEEVSVMSLAIDPSDPDVIWAGTEPSAVFRSTDGGEVWKRIEGINNLPSASDWSFPPRPYTHHVRCIEIDPTDPDRVYVGIEAGALLVTPDAGETWIEQPRGSRRDNHALATHPDAPGRVYSAAGDGYAESSDYGDSWRQHQENLEHGYVWSVAVDPGDPDTVLISAAHSAAKAHGHGGTKTASSHLYRRDDGEWNCIDEGIPVGDGVLRTVLSSGTTDGEFYAVNNHGVYHSEDGGISWELVPIPWSSEYRDGTATDLTVV